MHSHWSLVLFTLVVQAVAGHIWCLRLALFFGGCRPDSPWVTYQLIAGLSLALVGLLGAMAHLGRPMASVNAVRNIRQSWLSREIASVNLFAGTLALITGLALFSPGGLPPWMFSGECLIAGAALFTMTRVYLLRTVPGWNHIGTPLAFTASALILGAVLFALSLTLSIPMTGPEPEAGQMAVCRYTAFTVLAAGLVLRVLASSGGVIKTASALPSGPPPVMQTAGVCLWALGLAPVVTPALLPAILTAAALLLVAGEIADRIRFYNNYQRLGL